jgi:Ca-activated chloride channel family protein
MLSRLDNDRVGLIVFAGDSYLQLPLTTDYSAMRLVLSTVGTNMVPVQGTSIGSAIRLAMKAFVSAEKKHKVIILVTDGEDHEADALEAAREAAEEGIVLHAVGMGSPDGAPLPVREGPDPGGGGSRPVSGFRKDDDGNVVISKLNEEALREIASAGNGTYARATNRLTEFDDIYSAIEGMEKKEFGAKIFTEYEDRFQYFLGAALLFLLIEFFIPERKPEVGFLRRLVSGIPGARRAVGASGPGGAKSAGGATAPGVLAALVMIAGLAAPQMVSAQTDPRAGAGSVQSPAPVGDAGAARGHLRDGNREYEETRYPDAEISYRKSLQEADPEQIHKGRFNLGDALYRQDRFDEAAQEYGMAAEGAPAPGVGSQALHNLGNSFFQAKKYKESVEAFKQALRQNPSDEDTRHNLELARRMLKQQEQEQQKNQDQKKDDKQDKQDKQDQQDKKDQQDQKDQQQQDQQDEQKQQDQQKNDRQDPRDQQNQQDEQAQKEQQPPQDDPRRQQPQLGQISKEDAERILEALKNQEQEVKRKLQQKVQVKGKRGKDW